MKDLPDNHDLGHLRAALSRLSRFGMAVDGGAHRGIWTKELAQNFERVVAFEPRAELASMIEGADVVRCALGNRRGTCSMADGPDNNGQGYITQLEGDIEVRTLDEYELDVDFLKLDVEGYELFALKGAEQTIDRYRPAIMVEMNGLSHRYGYSDSDLIEWLEYRGYEHVARWNKDSLFL